jgi:transcription-repair coupling factor (superfamily II helicase)
MLLPMSRSITPVASKRLKAIEEYSHLGAGFRIALRDLEIRGAGNILGPEQSGHIQLVGYQMYCEMLARAVRQVQGEVAEERPAAVVELGFAAYIPKNYIPSDRHRMDAYRKIAVAKVDVELKQVEGELADVYGPLPRPVQALIELAHLRILASKAALKSIVATGENLVFSFIGEAEKRAKRHFSKPPRKYTVVDSKTVYLHLSPDYFERETIAALLRKLLG